MNKKITLGVLLLVVGGSMSVVGIAAADGDLLNGSVTEEVEPDGEIVVDAQFDATGETFVNVTAAEAVTVDTSSGEVNISSGTELFTSQDRKLNATVGDGYSGGTVGDTVVLDVTGDNITGSTTGTLTQDSFNVTVGLNNSGLTALNSTTVSVSDPGFFGGLPGLGEDAETGRNVLIGGILLLAGYLYIRDDE